MEASISDLRKNTKRVLEALERHETVTITYRGKARARLTPLSTSEERRRVVEHPAFGMWRGYVKDGDVPAMVRALRKGRHDAL